MMRTTRSLLKGVLAVTLIASSFAASTVLAGDDFTLAEYTPNDVLLFTATKGNPERDFIDRYWDEVFDELEKSGLDEDLIDLFSTLIGLAGQDRTEEINELKDRALQLIEGVDWDDLGGRETAFIERITPLTDFSDSNPPILMPDMVLMLRGSSEGASRNYEGLVRILDAAVAEINKAVGARVLLVRKSALEGMKIASVNLLEMAPVRLKLPLSVALRGDIIVIGIRETLFADVMQIMDGNSKKKILADDPHFRNAFAGLPAAEDSKTFFNMQALIKPLRSSIEMIVTKETGPRDVYVHSGMKADINGTNADAMAAYKRGNIEQALALTKKAYEKAPNNCIILYNMACFNTLAGNRDEGLDWLGKAVKAGFYAPRKISGDMDLDSLRGDPRYEAALAMAAEMSTRHHARDVVENYSSEGEAYSILMKVHQTYETKDYEQGLKLIKQAYAIAPDDSKIIYTFACLHTLLGHAAEGLDFLDQAVEAGFYCPRHMMKDLDLESVRNHPRFEKAVAAARKKAEEYAVRRTDGRRAMIKRLIDRIADAAGILDYSATVETTDGYSTETESITVLVPGAEKYPVYSLFGKRPLLTDFDRYLPEETKSFSIAGGIDLDALYEFIWETVALIGPEGMKALAELEKIQEQIGIDIRRDVIDWIDGDSISLTMQDGSTVTLFKVRDEKTAKDKIAKAIDFGSNKMMEVVSQNPALAGLAMMRIRTSPVKHDALEGFQNIHFTISPEPLVWGVADGYVIFGSSADSIALCLATARGEHPSIRSNANAMKEALLPDGPFCGLSLSDRRSLGEDVASGFEVGSMVCGMMGAFIPDPKARPVIGKISNIFGKLAPVARKVDFYKSAASCTTFDGKKWHNRSVTHYFSPEERK